MKTFFLILLLGTIQTLAQAQTTQKTGYAEWEYIFSQMPEYKQIEAELKSHSTQLESQLKAKYAEYEKKLKAYQEGAEKMVDAIRKDKEIELTQLQENIQKFQQEAQASIQKKQDELMSPIFGKVGDAIEKVAKEKQYTYILNSRLVGGTDVLLYADENYDISDFVLEKMGVTPKPTSSSN